VIESVELSLYLALAELDGEEVLIADSRGALLKRHSLGAMKQALAPLSIQRLVLRQRSAYDEMVGHSHAPADNTLEVELSPEAGDA
jgi:hypothetical protein